MDNQMVYILMHTPFWWDERKELQLGWPRIKGVYATRAEAISNVPRGYVKHGVNNFRHEKRGYMTITKRKVEA